MTMTLEVAGDVQFFVPGLPAPKGSKKHVGRGRMVESCRTLPAWVASVKETAMVAVAGIPQELLMVRQEPVAVDLTFVLERPARMPKGRFLPSVPPDLDKLVRATLDALTKITYWDDAQVCDQRIKKVYGDQSGCRISIVRITRTDPDTLLNNAAHP